VTAVFSLIAQLLHTALVLAAAPVLTGVLALFEARLQGRIGPHPLQPWRDLLRLFRKQSVLAENVSWLFQAAPAVAFAATAVAAMLVPSFALGMTTAPAADLLVIAGLMMLARCVVALAAMDTGAAFGGIGASRSMFVAVFAEPALLVVFFVFALLAGSTNLDAVAALREGGARASLGLALPALLAVALAETGRVPADGRAAAELAMLEAAAALEYSGRLLALLEATAELRLLVWLSLIAVVFVPFGVAPAGASPGLWLAGLVAWAAKFFLLVAALAVFQTAVARMRLFRVPEFLGVALLLALLAAALVLVGQAAA
jgi:formate hydrogenlyase subunit 4